MKEIDVLTLGETMVSFTPTSAGRLRYAHTYGMMTAGAEGNVAIGLARLGYHAVWLSRLGKDEFGSYIFRTYRADGVDVSCVQFSEQEPTGVMFKQVLHGKETSVFYYRKGSAASKMCFENMDLSPLKNTKILHLSGVTSALSENCRILNSTLARKKTEYGYLLSFDPNIRFKLWSRELAKRTLTEMLNYSDIVCLGEEEAQFLLDEYDEHTIIQKLRDMGVSYISIKKGAKGSTVADLKNIFHIPPQPATLVDSIGAGDAFQAGFLAGIIENRPVDECGFWGSILGAQAVSTMDDVGGLPDRELFELLRKNGTEVFR